ncbi:UDP-glucuronosyltransferase 2C1-like [Toxotes jaculatrix]|uniref:UDP-glucuronosyltransferase 2C1-like n=1 Tax=Toxotes jaculatrix TaxID=941984 RepID=UPI001B3AAB26|nr:UDP-glucuronosyltransferase 2C1-like [Toxotes jaculatrix]
MSCTHECTLLGQTRRCIQHSFFLTVHKTCHLGKLVQQGHFVTAGLSFLYREFGSLRDVSTKVPHLSLLTFTLLFNQLSCASGGKILVFPLDGSHWVNMKVLIEELYVKGHQVTVVRASDSWYISENSPFYTSVTLPCTGGFEENFEAFLSPQLEIRLQGKPTSFWSRIWTRIQMERMVVNQFYQFHKRMSEMVVQMFEDEKLMRSLRDAKYDVVLTDPGIGGGALLARRLQVPLVFNVRWTIQGEAHFLIAPSPLAYIPFTATEMTDRMTFPQRIKNVLSYILGMYTLSYITEPHYKPVVRQYFGPDVDYSTFFLDADIWLMRNDFVFEFPRPTMPNIVYMGGFQCKPPKPLPADLEEFVQSSVDHGVIIMTLGTLVGKLPQDVAEEIAVAFAQLPQKVIWRYMGQRPASLGNNTLLVNWLPQNDLLGHPKTRVFVTHGGTNGVQEAIYHGVPVVGLPLFFDQPDNLSRIRAKGGAVILDIAMLDRHIFSDALMTVLYNSSYMENMQRLSRLHRDQPLKPLDQAVFWIEYVIRHKGARHLQTQSNKMSWFVYNSIDVIAALLTVVLLTTFICISIVRFLWRMIFVGKKVKHE